MLNRQIKRQIKVTAKHKFYTVQLISGAFEHSVLRI